MFVVIICIDDYVVIILMNHKYTIKTDIMYDGSFHGNWAIWCPGSFI